MAPPLKEAAHWASSEVDRTDGEREREREIERERDHEPEPLSSASALLRWPVVGVGELLVPPPTAITNYYFDRFCSLLCNWPPAKSDRAEPTGGGSNVDEDDHDHDHDQQQQQEGEAPLAS